MEQNNMEQQTMNAETVRGMVQQMIDGMRAEMEKAAEERMKLESMTEEQKSDYAMSQREKLLQEREKKLLKRELKAKAMEILAARGLPKELAEALNYESEAECMNGVEKLETVFREAVQKAVDERLKGQAPASGAHMNMDADKMTDADYYRQHLT